MNFFASRVLNAAFYFGVVLCFVAPLAWVALTLLGNPSAWAELRIDSFRGALLARTLIYNALVAVVASVIAIPAAIAIGRARGGMTKPLLLLLPVSLLLPSIAFEYGWKQALRLGGVFPSPQSLGDVARCIWTLAAWLWPIPACLGALALRRFDTSVLEQSALDGVLHQLTFRILARPLAAGATIVFVLSSQEFAVFEPSGISVVATEVRMVFETGGYSSAGNPISQTFGAGGGGAIDAPDQSARAAAAIVTALPLTALTFVIAIVIGWSARKLAVDTDLHIGPRPALLKAPAWSIVGAYFAIGLTSALPIVAMMASHRGRIDLLMIWKTFSPQATGSLLLAAAGAGVSLIIAIFALNRRRRGVVLIATICFLVGGQMLAIGLIRLFNRDVTAFVYDSFLIAVLAYVSRFGWLALAAAATTWQRPWVSLREMASVDGASPGQALVQVLLPLAWPVLAAAGLLVGVLSMTEVAATVLLSPQNPQPLVPMLLQWVHLQRYDAMIEGTLLLCGVVTLSAGGVVTLVVAARRASRSWT